MTLYSKLRKLIQDFLQLHAISENAVRKERFFFYKYLAATTQSDGISEQRYFNNELIVSLTTYGKRIHNVYLAIESIMQQSIKPNKIILWLAENEFADETIPYTLKKLKKRGLEINYCEDIKSYKKLIPTLNLYPNDTIITIDDDIIYPIDFIERLLREYMADKKVIYFYRGHSIKYTNAGILCTYREWGNVLPEKSLNNFPTGVGGVLYPPKSLHSDVLNKELFMALCPSADDIWFKTMSLLQKVKCKQIEIPEKIFLNYFLQIEEGQEENLGIVNVREGKNDMQIKKAFQKYNITHNLFHNS